MNTGKSRLPIPLVIMAIFAALLLLVNGGCEYFIPNKPPYVEKINPADSAVFTVGQVVDFKVNAYDVDGLVIQVSFKAPNAAVYIDKTAPYEFSWQTAGMANGVYSVEIKAIDNLDEPYIISLPVRLLNVLTSFAGRDTTFTDSRTSCTLEGSAPAGSEGTWTIISGTGGLLTDIHNPNALFTGVHCQSYVLRWTVKNGISEVTDEVTIGFSHQPSRADAGPDQYITDDRTTTMLQALVQTDGFGHWKIESGSGGFINDTTLPVATLTGRRCSTYKLVWTVSTLCGTSSDTVEIRFDLPLVEADAGPDQEHTDGRISATLAGNRPEGGSGIWTVISGENGRFSSINDPKAEFTGLLCQSYVLRWTLSTPCTTDSDDVTITFTDLPSKADAGDDHFSYDGSVSVQLNATPPANGYGVWTITSGGTGSFSNQVDPNAVFTGVLCNAYVLRWTVLTACSYNSDEISVVFNQADIVANAGPDKRISDGSPTTTLNGNNPGTGSTGTWTIVWGEGGVVQEPNSPKSGFTGVEGQIYFLKWSLSNACIENADEVIISFVTSTDMTDPRDGKVYQTVKLGEQVWIAENLTYSATGSYSPGNSNDNIAAYGRLYDWNAAGLACPSGWHLPSDAEWRQLETFMRMDEASALREGYRGENEGGLLKDASTLYWESPNMGSSDIVGFGVRPAGFRTPGNTYGGVGKITGIWTATGDKKGNALIRSFDGTSIQIGRDWYEKNFGFSVRCVKK